MTRAVGAVVAHFPDTEGVTSSNLVSPTKVEAIRLDITEEPNIRAIGAAASALPSHGRGHRFDSYITHRYHSSVLPGFFSIPFHATSSNKNASIDAPAKTAIDEKRFTTLHKNCR